MQKGRVYCANNASQKNCYLLLSSDVIGYKNDFTLSQYFANISTSGLNMHVNMTKSIQCSHHCNIMKDYKGS